MIKSATIKTGFASQLEAIKGKNFKFTPGLNVLFGPNGCGKTSMLKILGAYSGTEAGWSKFIEPINLHLLMDEEEKKKVKFPSCFSAISPGKCEAKVDWDGTATFLTSATMDAVPSYVGNDSEDGLASASELIGQMVGKLSQGQVRIHRLLKMRELSKNLPDLTKLPGSYKSVNSSWTDAMDLFANYVKTLPREGPGTILLDEPDRSLSIPNQVDLWTIVMQKLSEKFQVIVATHCEYALYVDCNMIEMIPGYVDQCKNAIGKVNRK